MLTHVRINYYPFCSHLDITPLNLQRMMLSPSTWLHGWSSARSSSRFYGHKRNEHNSPPDLELNFVVDSTRHPGLIWSWNALDTYSSRYGHNHDCTHRTGFLRSWWYLGMLPVDDWPTPTCRSRCDHKRKQYIYCHSSDVSCDLVCGNNLFYHNNYTRPPSIYCLRAT